MKKLLVLTMVILLTAALSACATAQAGGTTTQSAAAGAASLVQNIDTSPLKTDYQNALPAFSQLALGTIKLDGTPNAVDSAQAAELLPLWKALRSLSTNQTANPAETQAVYKQLFGTMRSEQLQAIADLKLTRQDQFAYIQEHGQEAGLNNPLANMSPEQLATRQAARQNRQNNGGGGGGGGGGGRSGPDGPPPDGGFMPPDGGFPRDGNFPQGTPSANQRQGSAFNNVLTTLVIAYLQGK